MLYPPYHVIALLITLCLFITWYFSLSQRFVCGLVFAVAWWVGVLFRCCAFDSLRGVYRRSRGRDRFSSGRFERQCCCSLWRYVLFHCSRHLRVIWRVFLCDRSSIWRMPSGWDLKSISFSRDEIQRESNIAVVFRVAWATESVCVRMVIGKYIQRWIDVLTWT